MKTINEDGEQKSQSRRKLWLRKVYHGCFKCLSVLHLQLSGLAFCLELGL